MRPLCNSSLTLRYLSFMFYAMSASATPYLAQFVNPPPANIGDGDWLEPALLQLNEALCAASLSGPTNEPTEGVKNAFDDFVQNVERCESCPFSMMCALIDCCSGCCKVPLSTHHTAIPSPCPTTLSYRTFLRRHPRRSPNTRLTRQRCRIPSPRIVGVEHVIPSPHRLDPRVSSPPNCTTPGFLRKTHL
jgi:hypothetical protein